SSFLLFMLRLPLRSPLFPYTTLFRAEVATTGAWVDNGPSNAVSTRLGYRPNGTSRQAREGQTAEHRHYRMDREDFDMLAPAHAELLGEVQMAGLEELRGFLQITTAD